jgi:hypothetical protein
MRTTSSRTSSALRSLTRAAIAAIGIAALVGSGGGMPDVDLSGCCQTPSASVQPPLRTVGVGDSVKFEATVLFAHPPVTYQWRRNGVDIAGASSATYSLVGANLGDDGAQFSVFASASNGTATASATLQVSPLPAIVYQDGDFALANWSVTATATPPQGGSTQTAARADSGGNPDAYRSIRYEMTTGPSSITVHHTPASATYDPAAQGAIYGIDTHADCIKTGGGEVTVAVALEQAGRRYDSGLQGCTVIWTTAVARDSLRATDFTQTDGPACATGEACPNFSASGAPIRLGLVTAARIASGQPAATFTQGVDNWKVSVWRR